MKLRSGKSVQSNKFPHLNTVTCALVTMADANDNSTPSATQSSEPTHLLTGYRPNSMPQVTYVPAPVFKGGNEDFEIWMIKFEAHLRKIKLGDVLTGVSEDAEKDSAVYDELITALCHEGIRAMRSAPTGKGKEAYELLCRKYLGDKRQRRANALFQLANLQLKPNEDISQFVSRCDMLVKTLDTYKTCNCDKDDSITVALMIRGLPKLYDTYTTIATHSEYPTYTKFKEGLINFVSQQTTNAATNTTVMSVEANDNIFVQKNRTPSNKNRFLKRQK